MNKLVLLLFMPFFIGCGTKTAKQDISGKLRGLLAQKKWDSLAIIGAGYKWEGNLTDSGFKEYIILNNQIGDSVYEKEPFAEKKACIFFEKIIAYEQELRADTMPGKILLNALFKWTDKNFSFEYDENIVNNFKRCLQYQEQFHSLSNRNYLITLQSLGIQYDLLGEKKQAFKYYNKILDYGMSTKHTDRIASASINCFSYYTEYRQYDSVIKNAPVVLAYPGISLKRRAAIQAYYAEALFAKGNSGYRQELMAAWDSLQRIPYKDVGKDEWGKKSDVLKVYGKIALAEGQYNTAISFFRQALDTTFKKAGTRHHRDYSKVLLSLSNVYSNAGGYDSALYYCQYALSCVTRADSANISSNPEKDELYTENTIMEA
jgi:tetratricopeptide (TPR) repeat protein